MYVQLSILLCNFVHVSSHIFKISMEYVCIHIYCYNAKFKPSNLSSTLTKHETKGDPPSSA